jgi:FkbM family methyltransferase
VVLYSVADKLDRIGLRALVAKAATLVYPEQAFTVDSEGRWINEQAECTVVSPTIHTATFASIRARVLDQWCYCYTPKKDDVVVDCGAATGEEAIVFSSLVGRVISIEAHPIYFGCLTETIRRSGLPNVTPVHAAVLHERGTARIDSAGIASSVMRNGTSHVPQISIADLGLSRIDLLRMNIEGAERLAVHGVPWENVSNAVISCHDFAGLPSKTEVRSVLEREGFEITSRKAPDGMPWVGDYLYATRR